MFSKGGAVLSAAMVMNSDETFGSGVAQFGSAMAKDCREQLGKGNEQNRVAKCCKGTGRRSNAKRRSALLCKATELRSKAT